MQKEIISKKQARYILVMFLLGDGIFGLAPASKQDIWISLLLGYAMYLPVFLLYLRITSLYPGRGFYDIVMEIFGKVFGRAIVFLYICYALFLGGTILKILVDFIHTASLPETPQIVFMVFFMLFCTVMTKCGIEPFGRWCQFLFPFFVFTLVATSIISINAMDFNYLKPVGGSGLKNIVSSAFSIYSYPFAESVMFLTVLGSLKKTDKPRKIIFTGTLIALMTLLVISLRNLFILGPTSFAASYPSYEAVGTVSLGNFFSRFEILIAINYMTTIFAKTSFCQYAAVTGMGKFFHLKDYKTMAFPAGFIMITVGLMFFPSATSLLNWKKTYSYLAQIFELILPLIIWLGGEIRYILKGKAAAVS